MPLDSHKIRKLAADVGKRGDFIGPWSLVSGPWSVVSGQWPDMYGLWLDGQSAEYGTLQREHRERRTQRAQRGLECYEAWSILAQSESIGGSGKYSILWASWSEKLHAKRGLKSKKSKKSKGSKKSNKSAVRWMAALGRRLWGVTRVRKVKPMFDHEGEVRRGSEGRTWTFGGDYFIG